MVFFHRIPNSLSSRLTSISQSGVLDFASSNVFLYIKSLQPMHASFPLVKDSRSRILSMDFCVTNDRKEQILLEL
jgi:hypothetical protein